ncbi:hypothetical protein JD844_007186 [Phrynosoma platyrhinos]|uniref:Transferrin-like domain-containing protein n=1 Tax=Phrynosoma platyrhinos TaxID=52577 RepID=A0ABQ7T3A4_PHRPL|nr:hypothetical protein JD844_007186 [Phrynosoma platyrhinos]
MKLALQATLSFGLLALCLATSPVRWCVTSAPEQSKCQRLQTCFSNQQGENLPHLSCVKKSDVHECIKGIANNEADAISLDGGLVFEAGLAPYNLKPIVSEVYATRTGESVTSYYAVAVVKKGTIASLADLKGKKSCHTGLGRSAGWNIPIGTLVAKKLIDWEGADTEPIEKEAAEMPLTASIAAAAKEAAFEAKFVPLNEIFATYAQEKVTRNVAEMILTLDIQELLNERSNYELLCEDGTKKPIEEYAQCNLARVPAHAVVARSVDGRADDIWTLLSNALERYSKHSQVECQLFGPSEGTLKDLIFKDSAVNLRRVPDAMDFQFYLGNKYYTAVQSLRIERIAPGPDTANRIVWCSVGTAEKTKCDLWSGVSNGAIDCAVSETTDDCIMKILKGEADAISLDGGYIYTAGKCGLVPVLAEVYSPDNDVCNQPDRESTVKGYTAVAVAKASDPDITWKNLKGKKSCHTGVDRTAGWNIPMGLIYNENNKDCDFGKFFSEGCAPGAAADSPLCRLCKGSGGQSSLSDKYKCKPNSNEIFYGYNGAFRCLIESGDVAFVKHSTVFDNTGENKPAWVGDKGPNDFVLLAPNGRRCPVSEYLTCGLATVPTHGVVTRPDRADDVRRVMLQQQTFFGNSGSDKEVFQLFQSDTKDSLFKDGTACLATPKEKTYEAYLGKQYMDSVAGLKECSPSELQFTSPLDRLVNEVTFLPPLDT